MSLAPQHLKGTPFFSLDGQCPSGQAGLSTTQPLARRAHRPAACARRKDGTRFSTPEPWPLRKGWTVLGPAWPQQENLAGGAEPLRNNPTPMLWHCKWGALRSQAQNLIREKPGVPSKKASGIFKIAARTLCQTLRPRLHGLARLDLELGKQNHRLELLKSNTRRDWRGKKSRAKKNTITSTKDTAGATNIQEPGATPSVPASAQRGTAARPSTTPGTEATTEDVP